MGMNKLLYKKLYGIERKYDKYKIKMKVLLTSK